MWKNICVLVAFAALASGGSFDESKKTNEFKNYYKQTCRGIRHIMHTYRHDFSNKRCGPKDGRKLIKMTEQMIDQTLHEHNVLRATFARGEVEGYSRKVKRMSKLRWDPELAYYAELLALQCLWGHDKCHYTSEFPHSGQNLFMRKGSAHTNPSELINLGINGWFSEKNDIPNKNRNSSLMCTKKLMSMPKQVGHFTAMIHEYAIAIGCALVYAKCGSDASRPYAEYFYCNYGANNILDQPIYRVGSEAGEECATGPDQTYPGLCSSDEVYTDTIFVKPRSMLWPVPPVDGAVAKVYVESPKSVAATAPAAESNQVSWSSPGELLSSLKQKGVPKEVVEQIEKKMKLGPLKGKYTFRVQSGRDTSAVFTLNF